MYSSNNPPQQEATQCETPTTTCSDFRSLPRLDSEPHRHATPTTARTSHHAPATSSLSLGTEKREPELNEQRQWALRYSRSSGVRQRAFLLVGSQLLPRRLARRQHIVHGSASVPKVLPEHVRTRIESRHPSLSIEGDRRPSVASEARTKSLEGRLPLRKRHDEPLVVSQRADDGLRAAGVA